MPRQAQAPLPQPVFSEPVFNEDGIPTPDPTTFRTAHDNKADTQLYKQIQNLLSQDTVSFPASRGNPGDVYSLASALGTQGPSDVKAIQNSGKIVFHAAGDTGATTKSKQSNELSVVDHVTNDFHASTGPDRPSFFFHLGDVVYDFGESQYYYDQFYDPFRNYPAPIFAIPGNHDSFVVPNTPPTSTPLTTFMRNFCSQGPAITQEAGSLHRTAMTQPGVYFALDAPFLRIIGLFSNSLEDPGVISSQKSQGTKWPNVPDHQIAFLGEQLKNVKAQKYTGAVIVAVHHAPIVYAPPPAGGGGGGHHSGSRPLLAEIDTVCQAQGVYPHAVLSGHSHNYQRFTRGVSIGGATYSVPFIIAGNGGFNVKSIESTRGGVTPAVPKTGVRVDYLDTNPVVKTAGLTFDAYDENHYGYLRITVDSKQLHIEYHPMATVPPIPKVDTVNVDLAKHTVV